MTPIPESLALCHFSRSEVLADRVLEDCPLSLKVTAAKACPCKKRIYDLGPLELRVLSCTYPNTWKGEPIHDEDALRESLQPKRKPREKEGTMNDATDATAGDQGAAETAPFDVPGTALTAPANGKGGRKPAATQALLAQPLSMYDKIGNPAEVIPLMGKAIFDSKMFGCHTLGQGVVLAWACFAERRTPIEIKRRYHLVGGELSMKADAMLAEFRSMHGGTHEIIERSPDRAAIRLTRKDGKVFEFSFTLSEALCEDYIYTKEANAGKVPKVIKGTGEPNVAAFKDNWSTPRRRMQMMWARVVSDAVRAVCPEVNAGAYTPEELGACVEFEGEQLPAQLPAPAQPTAAAPVAQAVVNVPTASTIQPETTAEAGSIETSADDAAEAAEERAAAEAMVTNDQLAEMVKLKKALEMGTEVWLQLMGKFNGKTTAKALTFAEADRALAWLRKKAGARELDNWANGAVNPKPAAAASETPAGK